ncbi:MAG: thioesterase family protein [Gammaproteobacteria bacterium]|nr:thioesterase family protein [Gammaproteobacteria bacterium]
MEENGPWRPSTLAPLERFEAVVQTSWCDFNGHMNMAYYVLAFDNATDVFFDHLGLTQAFRRANRASTFAAETHVVYKREVHDGDRLLITTQLLDFDPKRIHFFHRMYHADGSYLAAVSETLSLYMDMQTRRVGRMPAPLVEHIDSVMRAHADLALPEDTGRVMRVPDASSRRALFV